MSEYEWTIVDIEGEYPSDGEIIRKHVSGLEKSVSRWKNLAIKRAGKLRVQDLEVQKLQIVIDTLQMKLEKRTKWTIGTPKDVANSMVLNIARNQMPKYLRIERFINGTGWITKYYVVPSFDEVD